MVEIKREFSRLDRKGSFWQMKLRNRWRNHILRLRHDKSYALFLFFISLCLIRMICMGYLDIIKQRNKMPVVTMTKNVLDRCRNMNILRDDEYEGTNSYTAAFPLANYQNGDSKMNKPKMKSLNLKGCHLSSFYQMEALLLETFPTSISKTLKNTVQKLDISSNSIPFEEIDNILKHFPNLEMLFVSNSKINLGYWKRNFYLDNQKQIITPQKLRLLCFKSSGITGIDDNILPESLNWLILTNNTLSTLPPTESTGSGKYGPNLIKLALSSNQITHLPSNFDTIWTNLELIRIAHNPLDYDTVIRLIQLPSMAYFGLGTSTLTSSMPDNNAGFRMKKIIKSLSQSTPNLGDTVSLRHSQSSVSSIEPTIKILKKLGQGASGEGFLIDYISSYNQSHDTSKKLISQKAVLKKFHSLEGGTDGYAIDEIEAQMAVHHQNIVNCLAIIVQSKKHTQKQQIDIEKSGDEKSYFDFNHDTGIVVQNIPDSQPLAHPPSLYTISRDVYKIGDGLEAFQCEAKKKFTTDNKTNDEDTIQSLTKMLLALARAGAYLHGKGVDSMSQEVGLAHGDFYGHNILIGDGCIDGKSQATKNIYLSDFGASFFYFKENKKLYHSVEGIEVRAWAILAMENILRFIVGTSIEEHDIALLCKNRKDFEMVFESNDFIKNYVDLKKLTDFVLLCWEPTDPTLRPRFDDIVKMLKTFIRK